MPWILAAMMAAAGMSPPAQPSEKLRVLMETDAGGDPDDEASLVRFLVYSNEWDVEGLIADRPKTGNRGAGSGLALVRKIVRAYGEARPNLVRHKPDYPTADYLLERTVAGYDNTDDGVNLVMRVLAADDPRPVWFANWGSDSGTTSSMKRALDRLQRERPRGEYERILSRLRVTRNAEKFLPHAQALPLYVDTRNPDKWYHRFRPLTQEAGGFDVDRDVRARGPLGRCYSTPKEGDSMAFIYLILTGLSDPAEPTWGSWGGRYAPMDKPADGLRPRPGFFWATAEDTVGGATGRDQTLARWAVHLQNDFRARMLWCVTPDPAKANHEPVPRCQGDPSRRVLRVEAEAGKPYALSAAGSADPDGDRLAFRWYVYPEPGTYRGAVRIRGEGAEQAVLEVPADAVGKTIHVILEVTDSGAPPLARYRRAVVTAR